MTESDAYRYDNIGPRGDGGAGINWPRMGTLETANNGPTLDDYFEWCDWVESASENVNTSLGDWYAAGGRTGVNLKWEYTDWYNNTEAPENYITTTAKLIIEVQFEANPENGLIDIYGKNAVHELIEVMKNIHQNKLSGNINELLSSRSLNFDKIRQAKTITTSYKNTPVELVITNPAFPPMYGEYYQVRSREYDSFGSVAYGSFDISGQYSILSIKISDKVLFYETYKYIFGK